MVNRSYDLYRMFLSTLVGNFSLPRHFLIEDKVNKAKHAELLYHFHFIVCCRE